MVPTLGCNFHSEFCFPQIYAAIDWSVPPKMLDKEFQQITPHGELGRRSVDKLVEVRLLSGETEWILIHLEIQNQWIADFAERMFVYFYRIRDRYNRRVVSLAVLGDDNPEWRPKAFEEDMFGCKVEFTYPMVKLNDFLQQMLNQPAASTNELLTEPLEALEKQIDDLMKELRSRGTH